MRERDVRNSDLCTLLFLPPLAESWMRLQCVIECCLPVTAALDVLVGVVSREAHRLDGLVVHIEAEGDAAVESLLEGIQRWG